MVELIGIVSAPEVKYVYNETELREVARLDELIYGSESIDYEGLCAWWRTYKRGVYVLWKDTRTIGAIGIWPIKKRTYDRLIKGSIDETDLKAQDICGRASVRAHPYWYFADIVLQQEYRNKPERLALLLMEEAIRNWLREGNLPSQIHVCALGFKEEGISLLQKFKFLTPGNQTVTSPRKKPVYIRTLTTDELQRELDYLSSRRSRLVAPLPPPPPVKDKYDVFISYRREYFAIANEIQKGLEKHKINVFLDLPDLGHGRVDKALLRNISKTPYFIVLLSPGCFHDCFEKKDWFRREIALAIRKKRKILPIQMLEFDLKHLEELPDSIRALPNYERVLYVNQYAPLVINEIIKKLKF